MKRIVIIGATGSGKTTLAEQVFKKLGYTIVDLDGLYWQPCWKLTPFEEFAQQATEATAAPCWIATGNYSKLRDVIWSRADTIIWLDYGFWLTLYRLISRSISRVLNKHSICNGNFETWQRLFSKESILIWFFKSYWKKRHEYAAIFENARNFPHLRFVRLRHPGEAVNLLETISEKQP